MKQTAQARLTMYTLFIWFKTENNESITTNLLFHYK